MTEPGSFAGTEQSFADFGRAAAPKSAVVIFHRRIYGTDTNDFFVMTDFIGTVSQNGKSQSDGPIG